MRKLAQKDESKEEKDDDIDDKTKEVEINKNGEVIEVVETDNDKLSRRCRKRRPPPSGRPDYNYNYGSRRRGRRGRRRQQKGGKYQGGETTSMMTK